mgnify:CR=1 FL=1
MTCFQNHHRRRLGRAVSLVSMLLVLATISLAQAEEDSKECTLSKMVLVAAADEAQKQTDAGTVEERAVPRMTPIRPGTQFKGGVIEGNRLRALPGYTLDVPASGSAFMLRPAGGGPGVTGRCNCAFSWPGCTAKRDGNDGVKCVAQKGCDACSIILENAAFGGMKAIQ